MHSQDAEVLAMASYAIDVTPTEWVFWRGETELRLKTVIHLQPTPAGEVRVVAVGERPAELIDVLSIALFDAAAAVPPRVSKATLLTAFIRHGIQQLQGRWDRMIKPVVSFRGVERLRPVLSGYEADVLKACVEEIAREVRFDENGRSGDP